MDALLWMVQREKRAVASANSFQPVDRGPRHTQPPFTPSSVVNVQSKYPELRAKAWNAPCQSRVSVHSALQARCICSWLSDVAVRCATTIENDKLAGSVDPFEMASVLKLG